MSEGLISDHGRRRIREVDWGNMQSRITVIGLVRQLLSDGSNVDSVARDVLYCLPRRNRQIYWSAVYSFVGFVAEGRCHRCNCKLPEHTKGCAESEERGNG